MEPLPRPPRLRRGDRVAIVATSGPVDQLRLAAGCAILGDWGLDVVCGPHVGDRHATLPHLAGEDAARAADLQAAWLDPSIAAVLCARGGYGAHRMIDLVDWEAMRRSTPKVFAGSSDVTALHGVFATAVGVSTLFAPMIGTASFVTDEAAREGLRLALFEPDSQCVLTSSTAETLVGGRATGVTVGGTVALLAASLATPHAFGSVAGAILLLEDIAEDVHRLDRMLTQLLRAGWFAGVAGIALGSWMACEPQVDVRALVLDRLGGLGVPVVWELGFGHCPSQLTVPLGVRAELDADAGTLMLLDPPLT